MPTNFARKTRPATNPYATWTNPATGWTYKLLKSWQGDNATIYARWLMDVNGYGHDIGDTYVSEMLFGLNHATDLTFDASLWPDRYHFLRWAGVPTHHIIPSTGT
jgi:hypothetical protein